MPSLLRQRQEYHRDKKLRDLARGAPCLAGFPGCNHDPATVVWCHSNQSKHGKGGSIKAHDCFGFLGCSVCNGPDKRERAEREEAENTAMARTRHWLVISGAIVGADTLDVRDDTRWLGGWLSGKIRVK